MRSAHYLVIVLLLCVKKVYCSHCLAKCTPCTYHCPVVECDCINSVGTLLSPPPATNPPPTQPPRPKHCPQCRPVECPLAQCPSIPKQCTEAQLETYYIVDCPPCIPQAGCQQFGCDCTDYYGNLLTPPTNPPQPSPRPYGCPNCTTDCLKAPMLCLTPPEACTASQLSHYVPKCPPCVAQAGCQQIGCFCIDEYGNIMIPAVNPAQPPHPSGCPGCMTICDQSNITCPPEPSQCTADQIAKYDYKNSPCYVKKGKC